MPHKVTFFCGPMHGTTVNDYDGPDRWEVEDGFGKRRIYEMNTFAYGKTGRILYVMLCAETLEFFKFFEKFCKG